MPTPINHGLEKARKGALCGVREGVSSFAVRSRQLQQQTVAGSRGGRMFPRSSLVALVVVIHGATRRPPTRTENEAVYMVCV